MKRTARAKQDGPARQSASPESEKPGKSGKLEKQGKAEEEKGPKVVIIEKSAEAKRKGPVRGVLGFEDELDQESLMAQAFADAGAEQEFAEAKAEVVERDREDYKAKHHIQKEVEMEGWGSWAGIVETGNRGDG